MQLIEYFKSATKLNTLIRPGYPRHMERDVPTGNDHQPLLIFSDLGEASIMRYLSVLAFLASYDKAAHAWQVFLHIDVIAL